MISALSRVMVPPVSASSVPPSRVPRCHAVVSSAVGLVPGLAQRQGQLVPGELVHHAGICPGSGSKPSSGLRRNTSAIATSLRAAAWASTRSHAHTSPTSS